MLNRFLFCVSNWIKLYLLCNVVLFLLHFLPSSKYIFVSVYTSVCYVITVFFLITLRPQCTASMSLCALEIFNLSFGVLSSPDSRANIFIFSLNDNFSGTASVLRCCCCCCFSANLLVRGSLMEEANRLI